MNCMNCEYFINSKGELSFIKAHGARKCPRKTVRFFLIGGGSSRRQRGLESIIMRICTPHFNVIDNIGFKEISLDEYKTYQMVEA